MMSVENFEINGKPIFIFKDHASALAPWSEIRRVRREPPNLLTLDFHTDTHTAFTGFIH